MRETINEMATLRRFALEHERRQAQAAVAAEAARPQLNQS